VAIEHIEKSIAEKAYELGYAKANLPAVRTGKTVAVVGSGPAGLAAAAQLNKAGHTVTVFERADRIGGLLRYGIPDFKLEKWTIDRKIALMEEEGVVFKTSTNIGVDVPVSELTDNFDAIVLCGGSTVPRDLPIKGRGFKGVHFAMDFLTQNNKRVAGDEIPENQVVMATDKNVLVIGGGDTGSDCVGTSNRHKAKSVTQIELLGKPPVNRHESTPWPLWPMELRTSSSHEEGCDRKWAILTKEFVGDKNGNLKAVKLVDIEWKVGEDGRSTFVEVEGSVREIPCELALLAIGFVHPLHDGMLQQLKVELDNRGNVKDHDYATSVEKIFVAGDMRRGQSLVVWAIAEGREAAKKVDEFLMGESHLEARDEGVLSLSTVQA
jgi:glutamate synthase (NADPH/NADH) small chain